MSKRSSAALAVKKTISAIVVGREGAVTFTAHCQDSPVWEEDIAKAVREGFAKVWAIDPAYVYVTWEPNEDTLHARVAAIEPRDLEREPGERFTVAVSRGA